MERQMDLLVVGAGPAGLSAAVSARSFGLDVVVLDEQASLGGQYFRTIESPLTQALMDSKEREQGLQLVHDFRASGVVYHPNCTVWGLEPHKAYCTINGEAKTFAAQHVLVATGGMERPVPFFGWTLPGVMGAGGADILLRSGGRMSKLFATSVVLAGNGPLILLLAEHLLNAGIEIAAWLDTGSLNARSQALSMPAALFDPPYLLKGLRMAWHTLQTKRVRRIAGVTNIRAEGDGHVERVIYTVDKKEYTIATNLLLRHENIIPRTHILQSMGAEHVWDGVQRVWYPKSDIYGATSLPNVYVSGDGSGVLGGDASLLKGHLTGIRIAEQVGMITPSDAAHHSKKTQKALLRIKLTRDWLRHAFAPHPNLFDVVDETIVCRCECVTAGDIRRAVADGYREINEIKRFTRCGMGQCQGRMCGSALAEIAANAQKVSPKDVGMLHIRQPFRPVSLEQYCQAALE